ncbi:MAG: thiamine ABC transporter substrate binding subunit [Bauldia sp.]
MRLLLSAAAAIAIAVPAMAQEPATLRIVAHDYFSIDETVLAAFEAANDVRVEIIGAGDANEVVDAAIAGTAPEADLLFGVDNLLFERAASAGIFLPYEAVGRSAIPDDIRAQFADSLLVTPIDYGFITLNWDSAAPGDPPASFEALTTPEWRSRLVVQDPALSSPGLQFLLTTIAYFGEDDDYDWRDFWADLRANDVHVARDWGEAYTERFTYRGGDRPLVVSYSTSPAAEVHFANGALAEPPTENVILAPLFRQVEAVAILAGTEQQALAEAFVDFTLTDAFQAQIPPSDHVYPGIGGLPMPDWWRFAEVEAEIADIAVTGADIDRWIAEWQVVMGVTP